MNGVTYTWDNNGNLLSDGVNTYTYDHANRLATASRGGYNASYGYSGTGDRLRQTVNDMTTSYTLDLVTGLTQVLDDGTETYLYGKGRIAQYDPDVQYFLEDALGSVRLLVNATGAVTLEKSYQPYGSTLSSAGNEFTNFAFTGEWEDGSTGMVYLRARYYMPWQGRFLTRDAWGGSIWFPRTLAKGYFYASNNPINYKDSSGLTDCSTWPTKYRWMCEQADASNLGTIELLYHLIADYANIKGMKDMDYNLSGLMLRHFLDGNGNDLDLSWAWGKQFGKDPNIAKASNFLFNEFMLNDVKPKTEISSKFTVSKQYNGLDYYTWDERPRPQSDGFYGGTGHVAVDGDFKAEGWFLLKSCKYLIKFTADYSVTDRYEWFKDKETHFGNVFGTGEIVVPHKWAIALQDAKPPRAYEYTFYIKWRDKGRLLVESDWSSWRILAWWEIVH